MIQLTTANQFGAFCFYINEESLRQYLDECSPITLEAFLEYYSIEESLKVWIWLKAQTAKS